LTVDGANGVSDGSDPDLDMEGHDIQELVAVKDSVIVRGGHPLCSSSNGGKYSHE